MWFKRASVRYSDPPELETPFQRAGQLWDERLGSARVQAYHWRLAALGALMLACIAIGGLLLQMNRSTITPYVVEVDALGSVRTVGAASESYRPQDALIGRYLSDFIRDVRSLPIDPIVLRQNWLDAYNYATDRAAVTLNDYARAADPFTHLGRKSVTVEIVSVVRASDSSFQLRWIEHVYGNGALLSTEHWVAILSLLIKQPRDEAALRKNPLGIYVNGLDWSQELGSAGR
jgi:type IV secretion system protein VirB5